MVLSPFENMVRDTTAEDADEAARLLPLQYSQPRLPDLRDLQKIPSRLPEHKNSGRS
jgi:hypothetical protein